MIRRMCEKLSAWSLSCLLVKVRALWGGCVSISDLDSAVPWSGVLHRLSVSVSYFLSTFYQFQTITIPLPFFHCSSPVFSQRISCKFPSAFHESTLASLCLLSTITSHRSPNSCLHFLLVSLRDKWHRISQCHSLSLSLLLHLPNFLIHKTALMIGEKRGQCIWFFFLLLYVEIIYIKLI